MTRDELLKIYPEIEYVPDEGTRELCINTWLDVLNETGWDEKGIHNCPLGVGMVADNCPEKAINHCRNVVKLCKMYVDTMGEWCKSLGNLDVNILLASAVLHDVGKFTEYDYVDGKGCHSPNGDMFKHPVSGAYYVKKNGLPDEIVYTVLAHSEALSPEHGNAVRTVELTILRSLDFLTYSIAAMNFPV